MPFVKLDCGILNSTIWLERDAREVFLTALLMAEPFELLAPTPQMAVRSLEPTGWIIPPGWYGLVEAAGIGIAHRALVPQDAGLIALDALCAPELTSRSPEFDGRRMARITGGYLVLNYMRYRERDYSSAERSKRYRQRKASRRDVTDGNVTVTPNVTNTRDITQAEAEVEVEAEGKNRADQDQTQSQNQDQNKPDALTIARRAMRSQFEKTKGQTPERAQKEGPWKPLV